jgi:hypothetical protein
VHAAQARLLAPFSAWARGPLRGVVVDALSPARVRAAGVLDADAVQRLLRGHLDGREDRGPRAVDAALAPVHSPTRFRRRPTAGKFRSLRSRW